MKSFKPVGALVGALIMFGALAGASVAGAATAGKPAVRSVVHFPSRGPGGQNSHACFWGVSYTQEMRNIIWPDSHTDYPVSIDTIPAGGKIVLHGRFPHARFFSLTTSSVLGVIRGHLYDTSIKPDAGSVNPFLPGANRTATHRSYTVTVVDQPDPGQWAHICRPSPTPTRPSSSTSAATPTAAESSQQTGRSGIYPGRSAV
jgi:hypothetical protein